MGNADWKLHFIFNTGTVKKKKKKKKKGKYLL